MGSKSEIGWTDASWNTITGCNEVSAGCKYCYAKEFSERLQSMGTPKYANGFNFTLHPEAMDEPLHWKKPRMVFVNSMSDTFQVKTPSEFIDQIVAVVIRCQHHTFQMLTKRPEKMLEYFTDLYAGKRRVCDISSTIYSGAQAVVTASILQRGAIPNLWLGTTVEDTTQKHRIDILRQIPAAIRWLSCEPLLSDLGTLDLSGISWLVCGGESGAHRRPFDKDWARSLRDQCKEAGVKYFYKQGSALRPGQDDVLDGRTHKEM